MDIETAKTLQRGEWLHHETQTQSGNQCLRIRVNGRVKTWKTRPNDIRIPVKWGLRNAFSLYDYNIGEWEREADCRNDSHPKQDSVWRDPDSEIHYS